MKIIIYEMHKIKLKNTYRLLFYSCLFVNFNFLDVSDMFWLKNNCRLKKKKTNRQDWLGERRTKF